AGRTQPRAWPEPGRGRTIPGSDEAAAAGRPVRRDLHPELTAPSADRTRRGGSGEHGHGQGSDMDRSLERARESARGFGMAELPNERTALCIEAMRRLDRLDTDAADRILAEVDEARPGQYLGP